MDDDFSAEKKSERNLFKKNRFIAKMGRAEMIFFFQRKKRNIDVILGGKKKFVVSRQKWSGEIEKKWCPPKKWSGDCVFFNKKILS